MDVEYIMLKSVLYHLSIKMKLKKKDYGEFFIIQSLQIQLQTAVSSFLNQPLALCCMIK